MPVKMFSFFEDYTVGDKFVSPARTITESDIVGFACLTGDFYPLHINEEYAKTTPFGTRIAHGPLVFSIAVGLVFQSAAYTDSVIAFLGANNLKALAPVRAGDTVRVEVEVTDTRETKKADRGVVTLNYAIMNQRDEQVMTLDFILMMKRKPAEATL